MKIRTYLKVKADMCQYISFMLSAVVGHRSFFGREAGRNSIEFIREAQDGDTILLALKFDSKAIAKDVLNR